MAVAIEVNALSKNFRYWADRPTTMKSILVDLMRGRVQFGERREFNVLDQVSFEIRQGEFVGIMGRNGAGKSTMMKLICGIYKPTSGFVKVEGRIAPLIELGAGFNEELSGYENIFLNSAILGFGRKVSVEATPKIIEFSELGDFIHMPVKTYSSGMLVRLGFAIATHLVAPILLIDEVLAVGDAGFQDKCLKKIHELHREGRTIVLVTHSADAVRNNCTRCIVLANQKKIFDGDPKEGAARYLDAVKTRTALYNASPATADSLTPQ